VYCSNCGKQVDAGMKFCSGCGKEISGMVSSGVEEVVEVQMPVRLVLCTTRKIGMLKQILCYVIFYDDRIVLSHISNARLKVVTKEFSENKKDKKSGFFGKLADGANIYNDYGESLKEKSLEENLMGDELNCQIGMDQLKKITFHRFGMTYQEMDTGMNNNVGSFVILTKSEKFKFTHKYSDSDKRIKEGLNAVVGKVLKYR